VHVTVTGEDTPEGGRALTSFPAALHTPFLSPLSHPHSHPHCTQLRSSSGATAVTGGGSASSQLSTGHGVHGERCARRGREGSPTVCSKCRAQLSVDSSASCPHCSEKAGVGELSAQRRTAGAGAPHLLSTQPQPHLQPEGRPPPHSCSALSPCQLQRSQVFLSAHHPHSDPCSQPPSGSWKPAQQWGRRWVLAISELQPPRGPVRPLTPISDPSLFWDPETGVGQLSGRVGRWVAAQWKLSCLAPALAAAFFPDRTD